MKFTDMSIKEFTDIMASDAPAPGGGAAAGLSGAQGAALGAMVCALTLGKKKYAEYQDFAQSQGQKARDLKDRFLELSQKDADTFMEVSAVFSMPKDTQEEKTIRKAAMEKALKGCTIPPYETMEAAWEGLVLLEGLIGKTYAGASSDIGVGAVCLKAAAQSAWLNVLINVGSISDEAFCDKYKKGGRELLEKIYSLADEIYDRIQTW